MSIRELCTVHASALRMNRSLAMLEALPGKPSALARHVLDLCAASSKDA
jgi:hypothetical protein